MAHLTLRWKGGALIDLHVPLPRSRSSACSLTDRAKGLGPTSPREGTVIVGESVSPPFRRRERAMQRFRSVRTLQRFSSVHDQVRNHFNLERHLVARQVYKQRRLTALDEWRTLAA